MFESDFLDFFSRVPWFVVPIIFLPIVAGLVALSFYQGMGLLSMGGWFFAGFVWWTFTEYALHRSLFHWEANTWWGPKLHFFLHGVHHKWFNDRYRLVMPPAAALFLSAIFISTYYGISLLLAPWLDPAWVWVFFGGKVLGYINYDMTHYYIHHGRPKLAYYKKLRAHHNAHHHNAKYKERKFGVSFTFWDHVFGTY